MKEKVLQISQKLNIQPSLEYIKLISELEILIEKINHTGIFHKLKANPKGFYIYGSAGSGKTTLMNMFFESLKTEKKINMHFHDYFLDISRLLTKYSFKELITLIAKKIKIICFDEFFIESIADAKLLQDLFTGLIGKGVIIVLTSNFKPESLYEGGFNRELVFPSFSNFLKENLHVHELSHNFDFRKEGYEGGTIIINKIPEIKNSSNKILDFQNHKLSCNANKEEAIFEYDELFKKPRSVTEFIFICRKFHKIYIKNFRKFKEEFEDEIIRFRSFIDVAYLRNTVVFLEGSFSNEEIFEEKMLQNIKNKRIYSRLLEMSTKKFLSSENIMKRKWHNQARDFFESL